MPQKGKIDSNKNLFAVNGERNLNRPCNLKDFSFFFSLNVKNYCYQPLSSNCFNRVNIVLFAVSYLMRVQRKNDFVCNCP